MWIPLEATLVGSPFDEAVDKALYAYKDMLKDGKVAIIDPREGWQTYEPATLPAVEWRAESPSDEAVAKSFAPEAESFLKLRFDYLSGKLQKRLAKDPSDADALNALGVVCFEHGKTLEAEGHFKKVLEIDPGNAAAQNNLGSLAYLAGRFDEAMKMYQAASESDPEDAVLWMNMARAAVKLEQRALAEDYAKKAVELESSMEPVKRALLK
jgi:tetratricopeptide (TPR) repeat protein